MANIGWLGMRYFLRESNAVLWSFMDTVGYWVISIEFLLMLVGHSLCLSHSICRSLMDDYDHLIWNFYMQFMVSCLHWTFLTMISARPTSCPTTLLLHYNGVEACTLSFLSQSSCPVSNLVGKLDMFFLPWIMEFTNSIRRQTSYQSSNRSAVFNSRYFVPESHAIVAL